MGFPGKSWERKRTAYLPYVKRKTPVSKEKSVVREGVLDALQDVRKRLEKHGRGCSKANE